LYYFSVPVTVVKATTLEQFIVPQQMVHLCQRPSAPKVSHGKERGVKTKSHVVGIGLRDHGQR